MKEMQIDFSAQQSQNASAPSVETAQPRSNVTSERASHSRKEYFAIIVIDDRIQIASILNHRGHESSSVVTDVSWTKNRIPRKVTLA
jgi:hypothetical protein